MSTTKIAGWIVKERCIEIIDNNIQALRIISRATSIKEQIDLLKGIRQDIEQIKTEYEE